MLLVTVLLRGPWPTDKLEGVRWVPVCGTADVVASWDGLYKEGGRGESGGRGAPSELCAIEA